MIQGKEAHGAGDASDEAGHRADSSGTPPENARNENGKSGPLEERHECLEDGVDAGAFDAAQEQTENDSPNDQHNGDNAPDAQDVFVRGGGSEEAFVKVVREQRGGGIQ